MSQTKIQKAARARQKRTGEAYTTALAHVRGELSPDPDAPTLPSAVRRIPMVRAEDDPSTWTAPMPAELGRMIGFAWELASRAYGGHYQSNSGVNLFRLCTGRLPLDGSGWLLSSPRFCPKTGEGRTVNARLDVTRDDGGFDVPVEDSAKLFALWVPGLNVPSAPVWVTDGVVICPAGAQPVWGAMATDALQEIEVICPVLPRAIYRLWKVWAVLDAPLAGFAGPHGVGKRPFAFNGSGHVAVDWVSRGGASPSGPIVRAPNTVAFDLSRPLAPGEYIGVVAQELADDMDTQGGWTTRAVNPDPFTVTINGHELPLHTRALSYDGLLDLVVLLEGGASGAAAARRALGSTPTVTVGAPVWRTMVRGQEHVYLSDGLVFNVSNTGGA